MKVMKQLTRQPVTSHDNFTEFDNNTSTVQLVNYPQVVLIMTWSS